jgi:hypothetical protein
MSDPAYPNDPTPSLSVREAFDAMRYFLKEYWERGLRASNDVRLLLSAMDGSISSDGSPIDQAQWSDWLRAVTKVKTETTAKRH